MAQDLIDDLDAALAVDGEDVILRRIVGTGATTTNVDVGCRAKVGALSTEQIAAGIPVTELNVILSPTEITKRQWPGGTMPPTTPPQLTEDPLIPRARGSDRIIARGKLRLITFVDPKIVGGVLVRIDCRVEG